LTNLGKQLLNGFAIKLSIVFNQVVEGPTDKNVFIRIGKRIHQLAQSMSGCFLAAHSKVIDYIYPCAINRNAPLPKICGQVGGSSSKIKHLGVMQIGNFQQCLKAILL